MERIGVKDSIMLINTANQTFNMQEIQNRRFMYNPNTCTLILGRQYAPKNLMRGSHAEEHGKTGTSEPYDSFIRGWIGTGNSYKHGVIHFAPNIDGKNPDIFEDAYNTLQMFRENGADANTVIRGFGKAWEQPLSDALPGCTEQYYGVWAMRSSASVAGPAEAWSKMDGIPYVYTSKEAAQQKADENNEKAASTNVHYSVKEMEPDIAKKALKKWKATPEKPYIKVFIQTEEEHGKYSDVGEWLPLPANVGDLSGLLGRLGVDGERESAFIAGKVDSSIGGVCNSLNINEKLDELNMLAHYLDDMEPFELDNMRAILQSGEFDFCCGAATLINLMYEDNFNSFDVIDAGGAEEIGRYWEKEVPDAIPEGMTSKEYGKECIAGEKGTFTPWGYVYKRMDLTQQYNGVVPDEYRITDAAMQRIRQPERNQSQRRPSAAAKLEAAKKAVKPPAPGGGKKKDLEVE